MQVKGLEYVLANTATGERLASPLGVILEDSNGKKGAAASASTSAVSKTPPSRQVCLSQTLGRCAARRARHKAKGYRSPSGGQRENTQTELAAKRAQCQRSMSFADVLGKLGLEPRPVIGRSE